MRRLITAIAALVITPLATLAADDEITIARLLKDQWEIAGYTASGDNRSTFILFRNPKHPYLINCRVGYDVTREPRTFANCYKLQ